MDTRILTAIHNTIGAALGGCSMAFMGHNMWKNRNVVKYNK